MQIVDLNSRENGPRGKLIEATKTNKVLDPTLKESIFVNYVAFEESS